MVYQAITFEQLLKTTSETFTSAQHAASIGSQQITNRSSTTRSAMGWLPTLSSILIATVTECYGLRPRTDFPDCFQQRMKRGRRPQCFWVPCESTEKNKLFRNSVRSIFKLAS